MAAMSASVAEWNGFPSGELNPARAQSGSGPVSSGAHADGGLATARSSAAC